MSRLDFLPVDRLHIRITTTTSRRIRITSNLTRNLQCPVCGMQSSFVPAIAVAASLGLSHQEVLQLFDEGALHGLREPEEDPLVCLLSLP